MWLTPDGARYLRMAAGAREPMPFHLRWLLPAVLGRGATSWQVSTWLHVAACAGGVWLLAHQHGASREQAAVASLLWLGLPVTRLAVLAPVLVDVPGTAWALLAALLVPIDARLAVLVALVGGAISEKTPIFAALFAGEPVLLVGLAAPAARLILVRPGQIRGDDPHVDSLRRPLATGLRSHAGRWRDARVMLLPWGACLAALADVELWWAVPTAVAYSQLLVATDTVRLYQAAAPVVCIAAALVIPTEIAVGVLIVHWSNPWAGNGV